VTAAPMRGCGTPPHPAPTPSLGRIFCSRVGGVGLGAAQDRELALRSCLPFDPLDAVRVRWGRVSAVAPVVAHRARRLSAPAPGGRGAAPRLVGRVIRALDSPVITCRLHRRLLERRWVLWGVPLLAALRRLLCTLATPSLRGGCPFWVPTGRHLALGSPCLGCGWLAGVGCVAIAAGRVVAVYGVSPGLSARCWHWVACCRLGPRVVWLGSARVRAGVICVRAACSLVADCLPPQLRLSIRIQLHCCACSSSAPAWAVRRPRRGAGGLPRGACPRGWLRGCARPALAGPRVPPAGCCAAGLAVPAALACCDRTLSRWPALGPGAAAVCPCLAWLRRIGLPGPGHPFVCAAAMGPHRRWLFRWSALPGRLFCPGNCPALSGGGFLLHCLSVSCGVRGHAHSIGARLPISSGS